MHRAAFSFFIATLCIASAVVAENVSAEGIEAAPPNIIFILADDLGYGDVQIFNLQRGKISTPHMDRLASEGMSFTDAHSTSSVCTPTRYSILTGRYNWRTKLQQGVLYGFDAPLIAQDRMTVAGLLKQQGYTTAAFGKWHLGLDIPTMDGKPFDGNNFQNIDWDARITNGPVARGFDHFYGISASLDMPPYIYIEGDRFVGRGTATKAFHRQGPAEPDFEAVDVLSKIGQVTSQFIKQQDGSKPFFAYVPLTSPHTPIAPSKPWQGKSELGEYGDFVMQTDAVVGQIVEAIEEAGLSDSTIVIVSSDNGCSSAANIKGLQQQGHYPSAQFRGSKADLWDGGHRIPFIVRWPGRVAAGSTCDQTICQVDLMATCAELAGSVIPEDAGEDSISFLAALDGKPIESTRAGVIHHSIGGYFAYRWGKWKLLLCRGSGGWSAPNEKQAADSSLPAQLYDMQADPGETNNLYADAPEVVSRLLSQLQSDIRRGRSTAGADLKNDVDNVVIWKNKK